MLLQNQAKGRMVDEHIDMTAMCDVCFQLLTFLLLTYRAPGSDLADVPRARHGVGVEETEAIVLVLGKPERSGGSPPLFLPEQKEPQPSTREAIRAAVTEGVGKGQRKVVLQADGSVPEGEVIRVASVAAEVEGVSSLHIGVQEPE